MKTNLYEIINNEHILYSTEDDVQYPVIMDNNLKF